MLDMAYDAAKDVYCFVLQSFIHSYNQALKKHRSSALKLTILKCPLLLKLRVLAVGLDDWAAGVSDVWVAGTLDGGAAGGLGRGAVGRLA